jgi:methyl-accepting chemotaxis protein
MGMFFKVYGLVAVPTLAFIVLATLFFNTNFNSFKDNKFIMEDMPNVKKIVDLISALQVERGLSASFISGIDNKNKILKQRDIVDTKFLNYLDSNISLKLKDTVTGLKSKVMKKRKDINARSTTKETVVKVYSEVIRTLLIDITGKIELIAHSESVQIVINLIQLNEAKEKAGLLRAFTSAYLSEKKDLSLEQIKKLLMLYGEFKLLLNSTLYKFDDGSQSKYQKILSHKGIKSMDNIVIELEANQFKTSSEEAFSVTTEVINEIKKFIMIQISRVEKNSSQSYIAAKNNIITVLSSLVGVLLLILIFTFSVIVKLVKRFRINLHNLNNKVLVLNLISKQVTDNSKTVYDSSNNQAKGIQGTSSALHEIKAILESSSSILINAREKAKVCTDVTEKGKLQVDSMLSSIDQISTSNNDLLNQVNLNNDNMSKVTNIINEIAQKTNVINDIVFQTKILSFNASVEAARAGENGKGFSVVAEEIGQLANMSGSASKEIEDLITSSIEIVSNISKEMIEKIDHFTTINSKNISAGNENANQCAKIFEQIYTTVEEVGQGMENISSTSSEQREAIHDISSTIQELDQETSSNLKVVEKNFKISEGLKKTSEEMKETSDDMCLIVRGKLIESSNDLSDISYDSNINSKEQ